MPRRLGYAPATSDNEVPGWGRAGRALQDACQIAWWRTTRRSGSRRGNRRCCRYGAWRTIRMNSRFENLVDQLRLGKIDRRTFMVRAFAAGVSGSAVLASLSRFELASAQDDKASSIGNPDIPHITTTDKGTIRLYS